MYIIENLELGDTAGDTVFDTVSPVRELLEAPPLLASRAIDSQLLNSPRGDAS